MSKRKEGKRLRDLNDAEMDALLLSVGPSGVLEAFYDLTYHKILRVGWNPLEDPRHWPEREKPSDQEIKHLAAIRALWENGFIEGLSDQGIGHYSVLPSEKAEAVRNALNNIPNNLKEIVLEGMEQSTPLG